MGKELRGVGNRPVEQEPQLVRETEGDSRQDLGQVLECRHEWKEVYYGYQCIRCNTFYPFGCAPWDEAEDDEDHTDYF